VDSVAAGAVALLCLLVATALVAYQGGRALRPLATPKVPCPKCGAWVRAGRLAVVDERHQRVSEMLCMPYDGDWLDAQLVDGSVSCGRCDTVRSGR
jgi:hypothetical protein